MASLCRQVYRKVFAWIAVIYTAVDIMI